MIFSDVWFLSWNSLGTEPIGNHLHMSKSEETKIQMTTKVATNQIMVY